MFFSRELDFWEQQVAFYREVTGRYAATLCLTTLKSWAGLGTFKILPILFLLFLLGGMKFFVRTVVTGKVTCFESWLITLSLMVIYLSNLAGVYEDLFFITYLFNGQLGMIGAVYAISLLWRHCEAGALIGFRKKQYPTVPFFWPMAAMKCQ